MSKVQSGKLKSISMSFFSLGSEIQTEAEIVIMYTAYEYFNISVGISSS